MIGASVVVAWELSGASEARQRSALRMIGITFGLSAGYVLVFYAIREARQIVAGSH